MGFDCGENPAVDTNLSLPIPKKNDAEEAVGPSSLTFAAHLPFATVHMPFLINTLALFYNFGKSWKSDPGIIKASEEQKKKVKIQERIKQAVFERNVWIPTSRCFLVCFWMVWFTLLSVNVVNNHFIICFNASERSRLLFAAHPLASLSLIIAL